MLEPTPLVDGLTVDAITAYETQDPTATEGLRLLGAALALHGIAENGGLVGGAVENLFFSRPRHAVDDAAAGYRWLGLEDVADLVLRARAEYQRFRPTGYEDVPAADEALWEELDEEFLRRAPLGRLERAVTERLDLIAPVSSR